MGRRSETKRINRGPKTDGGWKMMMRGTEGGAGGRGRRLTALGGALGGGEQALTQLHPLTAAACQWWDAAVLWGGGCSWLFGVVFGFLIFWGFSFTNTYVALYFLPVKVRM